MADLSSSGQIQEFLRVLRRRRWQIVMPAIYVLALGTVFAVLVPKKYVISTRVELLEGLRAESDPALKNRAGSAVQREVENVANHLTNYSRIESVVREEHGLWPEYLTADATGRRDVIEQIRDSLSVEQIEKRRNEGSTFVDIEYRDVSGERAVRFLEDLIDRWVRQVVERDKNSLEAERRIFKDDVDKALLAYREAKNDYTALAKEMGIDPTLSKARGNTYGQSDPIQEALIYVQQQLQDVQGELASQAQAYSVAKEVFEQAPEMIPVDVVSDLYIKEQQAESAISSIELGLVGLQKTHSRWKSAEKQIAEIRARLEADRARLLEERPMIPNPELPGLESAKREAYVALNRLEAKEDQLLEQQEDKQSELNRRIVRTNELLDLKDRADERKVTYQQVYQYLKDKEIALSQLEAYPKPYEIIQRPQVDGADTVPSAIMLVLLAAFAGLALGLTIAMAAEYAHNAYRTVADVAQVMAIPVLGTIDQIVTSVEARRVQARRTIVGLSSAVILGGLAWFTWIWAVSPNELPAQLREAIEQFRKLLM